MRPTYVQASVDLLAEAQELLVTVECAMAHYQERIHSLQQRIGVALSTRPDPTPASVETQPSSRGGAASAYVPDVR